jgi:hypothetical protein
MEFLFPHPAPVKVEQADLDDDDSLPFPTLGLDPDMKLPRSPDTREGCGMYGICDWPK